MKFRTIASMLFVSTLLGAGDSAQSDLRLMDLNVVALDDHGRPVTDLTADDFQISDAGKPQELQMSIVYEQIHQCQAIGNPQLLAGPSPSSA